ncbi:cilia- and flagella-associated protein 298-like isoform X2 [Camellia sinensis]|uniref:cilia- and flagella-associated protein 298-like isoform X2 n=1 Tax=Camellia sinensis TaxID=4442 RepID=UPI00103631D9|nr:cilia- and flagella-associated protein 298-like isoform X2 [Camellia sinensis]
MVRIQVKHGGDGGGDDLTEFLYDCPATSTTDEIARVLTQIANLQSTIQRLFLQLQPRLSLLPQHHQVTTLFRALSEAKSYVSKDQVLHNKPLVISALKGHVKSIEREFSTNYHIMGFPDSNLQQLLTDLELLQEDTVELLWARKKLLRGKQLCYYIGKNEKTKIMLRLQAPSSHLAYNSEKDLSNK